MRELGSFTAEPMGSPRSSHHIPAGEPGNPAEEENVPLSRAQRTTVTTRTRTRADEVLDRDHACKLEHDLAEQRRARVRAQSRRAQRRMLAARTQAR